MGLTNMLMILLEKYIGSQSYFMITYHKHTCVIDSTFDRCYFIIYNQKEIVYNSLQDDRTYPTWQLAQHYLYQYLRDRFDNIRKPNRKRNFVNEYRVI